ncbi:MAG: LytTR family DNA-binding domain-containing protein [Oscillospiraceae bacterium]|nr:LytTR family DNA-binding domain-containing protein [Oscillospiraceae bacterium]
MKILICDDECNYLEDLKQHVLEYMNCHYVNYTIDATTKPEKILENNISYDLAFLDIQMNEINGISLAKNLIARNSKVVIFFVTAYNGYQDDAMDLRAFRFFEKPFDVARLYSGLDKAMEYIDESYADIFLYDNQTQKRVLVDNIIYIKSENRRIIITTTDGEYVTREKLSYWNDLLPNSFFYQVHKSFLVNLHYIDTYKYTELILNNNVRIPISPRRQSAFHKYWFEYLRRR